MKEQVYKQVIDLTKQGDIQNANAQWIADQLHVSRNMISQYLNEFFNDGLFLKINTRPVLFLDSTTLEEKYHIHIPNNVYASIDAFQEMLRLEQNKDFENLIGYDNSLQSVVDTCKATISYPPKGLPFLLYGPTGTGKSLIASTTYEYAVHKGFIEKDKPFLILNCSEYANNPELLSANLFGHRKGAFTGADKDNPGLLKLAEDGILFLDEVHCLKAECQEKLFLFMDKGMYHMVGDNEHWYQSNARLIFATTEDPKKCLLKTLLRRIPMIVTVPSLQERGMQERLQLIYTIFKQESKRLNKQIAITNTVYNTLATSDFPGNIGDLKNCIQASCVHAYYKCTPTDTKIIVDSFDLPSNLVQLDISDRKGIMEAQAAVLDLEDLLHFVGNERLQGRLNNQILENFSNLSLGKCGYASFLDACYKALDNYYDQIMFKNDWKHNASFVYIQTILKQILNIVSDRYGLRLNNNDVITMTTYLHDYTRFTVELKNYNEHRKDEICALKELLDNRLHREYMISLDIAESLHANVDLQLDDIALCILTLYLKKFNRASDWNKRLGLILTHGYSTASSIADAANRFLDQYIFDAIDMPMNVTNAQIVEQIQTHLAKIGDFEEMVLLVDMGSLEDIYKAIVQVRNVNIGIMNNVSTKMALEVGNGIRLGKPLEEIFKIVSEHGMPTYHIISHRHKDPLILCSCASGLGTAERLKRILEDSLPKQKDIKILTYDYNTLIEKRLNTSFFDNYEIICIVGTLNPNIEEVPFIPLEDLIINVTMDKLHQYFQNYLDIEEIKTFKNNILKNFSLTNLITTLTILNPGILLEHVATALDQLQERMGVSLSNATCVGMYVHICCLIERLVTHASIDNYPHIDNFMEQHQDFIDLVKQCFQNVERYYSVEITPQEMAYMYEYIENNEEN
ncbi:sigma 54-interacting transcriptional regulator [Erysipelotrichaceae bacterium HCN-30851]|mgnify:FL=1